MKFDHWEKGLYGDVQTHYYSDNAMAKNERTRFLTMMISDILSVHRSSDRINVTIAEWGCNIGRNLMPLYMMGYVVGGFDINKTALIKASENMAISGNNFKCIDLLNSPKQLRECPDNLYDLTFSMGFLMHMPKGLKKTNLINNMIRVSKNFIIYEPIGGLEQSGKDGYHLSLEDYRRYSKDFRMIELNHTHPDNDKMRVWILQKGA